MNLETFPEQIQDYSYNSKILFRNSNIPENVIKYFNNEQVELSIREELFKIIILGLEDISNEKNYQIPNESIDVELTIVDDIQNKYFKYNSTLFAPTYITFPLLNIKYDQNVNYQDYFYDIDKDKIIKFSLKNLKNYIEHLIKNVKFEVNLKIARLFLYSFDVCEHHITKNDIIYSIDLKLFIDEYPFS